MLILFSSVAAAIILDKIYGQILNLLMPPIDEKTINNILQKYF